MLDKLRSLIGSPAALSYVTEVEARPTMGEAEARRMLLDADDAGDERVLLEGELRAARKIQMGMVPKTFPPIPGCLSFDLYAILEPASEIGGDFYDFWLNGREDLMLVVGDVSGNGIPAALFMAVCRTYLRAFSRSIRDPAGLLTCLNNELARHNDSCMFATLACARINIPAGAVSYAGAGHHPPLVKRRDGSLVMPETAGNPPVGFVPGFKYAAQAFDLREGDSLLLYSDGMPEAFNAKGNMLGWERMRAIFEKLDPGGCCRNLIGQLRAEVSEFTEGAEQSDDIAMLLYGQLCQPGSVSVPKMEGDGDNHLQSDTVVVSLSRISGRSSGKSGELGRSLSELANPQGLANNGG